MRAGCACKGCACKGCGCKVQRHVLKGRACLELHSVCPGPCSYTSRPSITSSQPVFLCCFPPPLFLLLILPFPRPRPSPTALSAVCHLRAHFLKLSSSFKAYSRLEISPERTNTSLVTHIISLHHTFPTCRHVFLHLTPLP